MSLQKRIFELKTILILESYTDYINKKRLWTPRVKELVKLIGAQVARRLYVEANSTLDELIILLAINEERKERQGEK